MTTTALILAAGKGTRMRSSMNKVLHPLCGRSMAGWALEAVREAGCTPAIVIGHQAEQVRKELGDGVLYAIQAEQKGTGHAVLCAAPVLPREGVLVVLPGDAPLVRGETLKALLEAHGDALCTVLTLDVDEPGGYGRIVRDAAGQVQRIVEAAAASPQELAITEVNSGIYAFDAKWLLEQIVPNLQPTPPKNEIYLTDAIEAAANAGRLRAFVHDSELDLMGVNDRAALSIAETELRRRINERWMKAGVSMRNPAATYVDALVELSEDVRLEPGTLLTGCTQIASGVTVGANCVLHDTSVAAGSQIFAGTVCEGATIGPDSMVGPMARLREGTVLQGANKVGNFVETKKTVLGVGSKASHLSYLGDSTVGDKVNIGAGTITCNYDGWGKHPTVIGDGAFIGSNSSLVAPVTVGTGAIVGAGSVVTEPVPDQALAVSRARQRTIAGLAPAIHDKNRKRAGQ